MSCLGKEDLGSPGCWLGWSPHNPQCLPLGMAWDSVLINMQLIGFSLIKLTGSTVLHRREPWELLRAG